MVSVERDQFEASGLLGNQPAYWREVPPDQVPTGAVVPLKLIERYVQPVERQAGLDLGCGIGNKTIALMRVGFTMLGLDISKDLIETARSKAAQILPDGAMFFQVGDATRLMGTEPGDRCSLVELVELFRFINFEALLCNLVGDNFGRVVQVIDYYLQPGGYVFIADCLRCNEGFDYLLQADGLSVKVIKALHQEWQQRYQANVKLGLPEGHFVVARPGDKKALEWGDVGSLRTLLESQSFERLARHFSPDELTYPFQELGMNLVEWQPTVFYSRSHQPLIGCLAVFQKPHAYKYAPGLSGQPLAAKEEFLATLAVQLNNEGLWRQWCRILARVQMYFGWPVWLEFMKNTLNPC